MFIGQKSSCIAAGKIKKERTLGGEMSKQTCAKSCVEKTWCSHYLVSRPDEEYERERKVIIIRSQIGAWGCTLISSTE